MKKITLVGIDQRDATYETFLTDWVNDKITFITFEEMLAEIGKKGGLRRHPDLLVFTGGEDVDPVYYNENKGSKTHVNPERDRLAMSIFKLLNFIPKLGICRGAQFLTVANGGKLIQHVENHTVKHTTTILIPGNNRPLNITTTSTHHQMLFPFNLNPDAYKIVAWSTRHRSDVYLNGKDQQIELPSDFVEPEIVIYPDKRSLAIQGHPELANATEQFKEITAQLIDQIL